MPLESFDRIQVPLVGNSMWPLLKSGQPLIVNVPREPIELQASDIGKLFIFKDNAEWVCHRYLGVLNDEHVFKGDFSTVHESFRHPHVLGHVLGLKKKNGYYFFKYGPLFQWLVRLQTTSILKQGTSKKTARYLALALALAVKPLFYRKGEPLNIVSKGFE